MAIPRLSEIIAAKEAKTSEYQPCNAYWLLVVVDWIDPAQEQEITTTRVALSSNVYERIIIYKPIFDEILDVSSIA